MKKFIVLATLSLFIGQSVLAGQGGCQLGAANKNRPTPKAKIGQQGSSASAAQAVGGQKKKVQKSQAQSSSKN